MKPQQHSYWGGKTKMATKITAIQPWKFMQPDRQDRNEWKLKFQAVFHALSEGRKAEVPRKCNCIALKYFASEGQWIYMFRFLGLAYYTGTTFFITCVNIILLTSCYVNDICIYLMLHGILLAYVYDRKLYLRTPDPLHKWSFRCSASNNRSCAAAQ